MIIVTCPHCTNVLAKGFTEIAKAGIAFTFTTRCPTCKKDVEVGIEFKVVIVANEKIQGRDSRLPPRNGMRVL